MKMLLELGIKIEELSTKILDEIETVVEVPDWMFGGCETHTLCKFILEITRGLINIAYVLHLIFD